MDEMKAKVEQYGIEDKVLFMGFRNDRNELMQAMDTFCFPSLYEGLSVVLIEAQASGMPVFASDSTTQETAYSPNMHFLSLHQSPAEWAKAVIGQEAVEREDMTVKIRQAGFDIDVMIDNFYKLYRSKQS
jgi:glycosyltransferase involved in cell wall biosynthesis